MELSDPGSTAGQGSYTKPGEPADPRSMLYQERTEELFHEFQGTRWKFLCRGLNAGTMDEIAGAAAKELRMEEGKPVAQVDPGIFNNEVIHRGVLDSPFHAIGDWTMDTVKALPKELRDRIIRTVLSLSDSLRDFKKKSGQPLVNGTS